MALRSGIGAIPTRPPQHRIAYTPDWIRGKTLTAPVKSLAPPPDLPLEVNLDRMKTPRITKLELALLTAVLLWAGYLRLWHLGQSLFWVDEAESTINALTILK